MRILTKRLWQDTELYFSKITPIPCLLYRTEISIIDLKTKTDIKNAKSDFKGYIDSAASICKEMAILKEN
jgi:hypothetical protein